MSPDPRIPLARIAHPGAAAADTEVCPGRRRGEWLARIAAWRATFAAAPAGDVVLHADDAFEFSAALFATWLAGRTPWLPADTLPATLARIAVQAPLRAGDLPGALRPAGEGDALPGSLDPADCRVVLHTSGSTGEPAAIAKSLAQLDAEIDALEAAFGAGLDGAVVHGTVSHQHIYGLLFRVLWPLSARRPFAPRRLAYPEDIAAVAGDRGRVLVASPAHLKRLPATLDWSPFAAGLQAVFSSGGPLPADAAADVRARWGLAPTEVFGSTETGGIAWRRGDTPWRPLPGVEAKVVDDRLHVRSPHLPTDAWWPTTDRAREVAGGFELAGRADRIVKIEERRISLDAIERRLLDGVGLRELRVLALPGRRVLVAAVGVPDAVGDALLAQGGRAALVGALRDRLSGHVDPIAWPRRWRFPPALPADARGKTSERALAALFRPGMPVPDWKRREAAAAFAELHVAADLEAFVGHFPQTPILPGVVLLDWAARLAGEAFGAVGAFAAMDTLKFQQPVRPGTDLAADLAWAPGRLAFSFRSVHGIHASGVLRFDAAEAA